MCGRERSFGWNLLERWVYSFKVIASQFASVPPSGSRLQEEGNRRLLSRICPGDAWQAELTLLAVGEVKVNLPQMLGQKEKSVKMLTGGIEGLFKKNKVFR